MSKSISDELDEILDPLFPPTKDFRVRQITVPKKTKLKQAILNLIDIEKYRAYRRGLKDGLKKGKE